MNTPQIIIRKTACWICFLALFWGCGEPVKSSKSSKVVSQKIVVEKGNVSPTKSNTVSNTVENPVVPSQKQSLNSNHPKNASANINEAQKIAVIATGGEDPGTNRIEEIGYFYDPEGKIDPFTPLIKEDPVVSPGKMAAIKPDHPPGPLEKMELSQLKLVGVIQTRGGNKALVEEATGKGYIVNSGTYIGIHGGKIIEIRKDHIVVEEQFEDITGKISVRHRELKLQKTAGEL